MCCIPDLAGRTPACHVSQRKRWGEIVRIVRHLLMVLALLSMVGFSASAASACAAPTVPHQASHLHHHHHEVDVAGAGHIDAEHHCPSRRHDGKWCGGACCGANCLSAAAEPSLGSSVQVRSARVATPVGDARPDGTIPYLPDRPPIAA